MGMTLDDLQDAVGDLAKVMGDVLSEGKATQRAVGDAEEQAEEKRLWVVRARAAMYDVEQQSLEAVGVPYATLDTQDTERPWMSHWILSKTIPAPPPSSLISATPVTEEYIEKAARNGVTDFAYCAKQLLEHNFCVIDDFYPKEKCCAMRDEIAALHRAEQMDNGKLMLSDCGTTLRSDFIAWRDGDEAGVELCNEYMLRRLDVFVQKVAMFLEAACPQYGWTATHRSKMMCTVYPGTGTHYVKHYDNSHAKNARILTCLLYLNESWAPSDGGSLRMGAPFQALEKESRFVPIAPLMGRALFFWSDERCPHEVSPSWADRYAITVWFIKEDKE